MPVGVDQGHLRSGRYILNHDTRHCAAVGAAGNHLYSGQALGLSEPWDMLQLPPELQTTWPDIVAHYRRIGLGHSEDVIWHVHPAELGEHIGYQPSVFYFGPRQCCYWGDNAWLETVEFIDSKNNFIALAAELGVDVPETLCFDRRADVTVSELRRVVYPCYVKAAVSMSGVGIYRCDDEELLLEALAMFDSGTPVQLQEELDAIAFLKLHYRVVGREIVRLAVSEQIVDGSDCRGHRVPAIHEPWGTVEPVAEWLAGRGIKGVFTIDIAVVQTGQGPRFRAIECNPRFDEASYPAAIAHKLGVAQWSAVTLQTCFRSLADIDLTGIEFDPDRAVGVVIVNWGAVLEGRLTVLLAGTARQQQLLRSELDRRLW